MLAAKPGVCLPVCLCVCLCLCLSMCVCTPEYVSVVGVCMNRVLLYCVQTNIPGSHKTNRDIHLRLRAYSFLMCFASSYQDPKHPTVSSSSPNVQYHLLQAFQCKDATM